MQFDTKSPFCRVGVGKPRAKEMDFMAAPHHFVRQINRLGGAASGRRIKRFVS
jgi:hypothetical protein